jgi:hypothetical protein
MSHPNPRHTITGRPGTSHQIKKNIKKDVSAGLEPATPEILTRRSTN